jgi:hypothetical protein
MDKAQKPGDSECYTPSSETFRIYLDVDDQYVVFIEPLALSFCVINKV